MDAIAESTPLDRTAAVDPVTASIIRHGLDAAADQMLIALKRTAFSPIIYEVMDGAGAFYDRKFRMLSQMNALPMFTGSLGLAVETAVNHYLDRDGIQEGDVIVVNDPFITGTHQWDVAVIVPGFLDGEIVVYAAIKAHHLDVAALAPFVTKSTDVFQEGTIYPGVKMWKAGVRDEDLYRMILANTRLPDSAAGDLNAQAGACQTGVRAVLELIGRYGIEEFEAAVEAILDAGEATMRKRLAEFPPGPLYGHDRARAQRLRAGDDPLRGRGRVRRRRDHRRPDRRPRPATRSGKRAGHRRHLGDPLRDDGARHPDGGRANEGYFRPLQLKTRPGSMNDAQKPAPVALGSYPLYILIEGINEAIANAMPAHRPAGYDMVVTLFMWGRGCGQPGVDRLDQHRRRRPGRGSLRGRWWAADADRLLGRAQHLLGGVGGQDADDRRADRVRHGFGRRRPLPRRPRDGHDRPCAAAMELTVVNERSQVPPFALAGGEKGRRNEVLVNTADGEVVEYSKVTGLHMPSGIAYRGAHGRRRRLRPARAPVRGDVYADIDAGYLTEAGARAQYPHVSFRGGTV